MFNKFVLSLAFLAAISAPVLAQAPVLEGAADGEDFSSVFWSQSEGQQPLQFFTERELKINGLITSPAVSSPDKEASQKNVAKTGANSNKAAASNGNKYGMPSILVKTSGVVYKKVPQYDHHRRSLASRGSHITPTPVSYKTVAVRQPMQLDITPIICKYAEKHNLDPWLVRAIIEVESEFCPTAGSWAGAGGLMQLMPATAASLGCKDRFDPEANIAAGTRYLRQMCNLYPNDIKLAIAAYNAGPGNVKRYGGIPPFAETRNYVAKVTRIWKTTKSKYQK